LQETMNANDESAVPESQPILTRSGSSQSGLHASPVDGKPEYFDITQRTELSDIAKLFLNKYGVYFFFAILALYLFGDIAITTVLASKSILNVIWQVFLNNFNFILFFAYIFQREKRLEHIICNWKYFSA
jgi:hypothetical protein